MLTQVVLNETDKTFPAPRKLSPEGVVKVKIEARAKMVLHLGEIRLARLTVISLTLLLQWKQNSGTPLRKND